MGDGIVIAAAPLLAASLTHDPMLVSGIVVAQRLPWFVFTLFAGVIVDRVDRRTLLVAANGLRAIALGALAYTLAIGYDHVFVLYAVMFTLGIAETIVDNAALAVLPRLLDRERLEWANGRIFATQSVLNELAGPPLGGFLFALSATAAFCTGSAAFAVAGLVLSLLPRQTRPVPAGADATAGVMASIAEGLRWFWSNRLIRTVALMAAVVNLFEAASLGVLVLIATDELGLGAGGYGLLLTGGAIGGIAAGLVADALIRRLGSGTVIFLSNLLPALSYLVLALTSKALVAGLALALTSFAATVANVIVITLRQAAVPDHLLGRVASAYRMIALGALPLGGLIGGAMASTLGLRAPFYVAAACLAVMAFVLAPVLTSAAIDQATGRRTNPEQNAEASADTH